MILTWADGLRRKPHSWLHVRSVEKNTWKHKSIIATPTIWEVKKIDIPQIIQLVELRCLLAQLLTTLVQSPSSLVASIVQVTQRSS